MRSPRRVLVGLLLALGVLLGGAGAASAAPGIDIPNPFSGCKTAPLPARPASSIQMPPSVVSNADPFKNPDTSIESVYGWGYRWINYDNGCVPGAGQIPSIGADAGTSIGLKPAALMGSTAHSMQSAVIDPTWLESMDSAIERATTDLRSTIWGPWLPVALAVVVVLILWRARSGRLERSTTTAAWALLVLGLVTVATDYPTEATGMVDDLTRTTVTQIATAFTGDEDARDPARWERMAQHADEQAVQSAREKAAKDDAKKALDRSWDKINRATVYRTWLEGTFGSADSATAKKYGPEVFKSTHMSWAESGQLLRDPIAGLKTVKAKQDAFDKVAEKIKAEDSYAYSYLTGGHAAERVFSTAPIGAVMALATDLFLFVASFGMFAGFVVIRIAVMLSPALGVIFLVEPARDLAIDLFKKVAKYVIAGPAYLLGGMIVLTLNSAIAGSNSPSLIKLLLMTVSSFMAWQLLKPAHVIPGGRAARAGLGLARTALLGWAAGTAAASAKAGTKAPAPDEQPHDAPAPTQSQDAPVMLPTSRPAYQLPAGRGTYQGHAEDGLEEYVVVSRSPGGSSEAGPVRLRDESAPLSARQAREMSRVPAGHRRTALPPGRGEVLAEETADAQSLPESSRPETHPSIVTDPQGYEHDPTVGGTPHSRTVFLPDTDTDEPRTLTASPHALPQAPGEPGAPQTAEPGEGERPLEATRPTTAEPDSVETETAHDGGRSTPERSVRVLDAEDELPSVNEANLSYDEDGRPVFVLYRPEQRSVIYRAD